MQRFAEGTLAALGCAVLAACATTAQTGGLECGLGGAVAGYAVCKAMGKPDAVCARTAAVVGAVGAAGCYSYGASLDRRRKELAGHENQLDARLRYVRGLNEDAAKFNADLDQRVADTTRQTDVLVAQVQQKRLMGADLAREQTRLDDQVRAANQQLAKSRGALDDMVSYRATLAQRSDALDVAIARQKQLYDTAQQKVAMLSDQRTRLSLGESERRTA